MEQVADIDVLPESDRMMSDRMRQGRERLLWADDAMVAVRLPKVELPQRQIHRHRQIHRKIQIHRQRQRWQW